MQQVLRLLAQREELRGRVQAAQQRVGLQKGACVCMQPAQRRSVYVCVHMCDTCPERVCVRALLRWFMYVCLR